MVRKRIKFANNSLLNLPGHHSTAAISWNVIVEPSRNHAPSDLDISDCSRAINLAFIVDDELEDFENSIFKVNVLISELNKFKKALYKARKIHLKYKK